MTDPNQDSAQTANHPHQPKGSSTAEQDAAAHREENFDKTLADSFPNSDPPSSIPNPSGAE